VAIQTPQVFEAGLLKRALINAKTKNLAVTDDCMAVEALGVKVKIIEGSYDNIKITTDEDLAICEAIIARDSFER
jgi:2-C-methyl-D-erythritol 4-phosphate cytidylyltransferase